MGLCVGLVLSDVTNLPHSQGEEDAGETEEERGAILSDSTAGGYNNWF